MMSAAQSMMMLLVLLLVSCCSLLHTVDASSSSSLPLRPLSFGFVRHQQQLQHQQHGDDGKSKVAASSALRHRYSDDKFMTTSSNNSNNNLLMYSLSVLRGGAMSATAATLQDADDESDLELGIDKQPQQDDDDEDEDDDEQDESATTTSTTTSNLPIKIHISTGLHSPLLDQHLEFSASSKRTLHSIKQAISKSMVGRPPISCIQLRYRGRLLEDDDATDDGVGVGGGGMTVNDILSHHDEDDDEDEDDDISNNNEDDEDEDDSIKLSLTADILPPIDAKFGIEFRSKIVTLSTKEIIEAYCLNMAGMMYGQEEQQQSLLSTTTWNGEDNDGMGRIVSVEDEEEDGVSTTTTTVGKDASLNIRKRAAFLQKQFESMFTEETKRLIEEEHARVMKRKNIVDVGEVAASASGGEDEEEIVYGLHSPTSSRSNAIRSARKGGRKGSKGGATMHVKKALQKNLNVNWADTTRNSLLFLFFGYFGGRNSFSRTFLLLSSPLCFFLQTRPVKVAMKQLFYTIGEPPGIILSLLPAPQQAIMSCDYGGLMKGLYGEKFLEGEEWLEMERLEMVEEEERNGDDDDDVVEEYNGDDEYDQYDDEPDSDGDY